MESSKIIYTDFHAVHINRKGGSTNSLNFEVYPIIRFSDGEVLYRSISDLSHTKFNEGEGLEISMHGTYCWRGVWEPRYYFPNDEYWYEDLEEMYEVFNNVIVPECRSMIEKLEGRKLEE